jgi:vacuolar protein sorting-associated protein 26
MYNESETITKFEIMDGSPVRGEARAGPWGLQWAGADTDATITRSLRTGEMIPIRLFLGGFELTPTFRDVNKKFSVRYYLNLVLIDFENR